MGSLEAGDGLETVALEGGEFDPRGAAVGGGVVLGWFGRSSGIVAVSRIFVGHGFRRAVSGGCGGPGVGPDFRSGLNR